MGVMLTTKKRLTKPMLLLAFQFLTVNRGQLRVLILDVVAHMKN